MDSLSLTDIGLNVLVGSLVVRLWMIGIPTYRFAKLFDGKLREGTSLYKQLEIEGFDQFVKQECILGFLPYIALAIAIYPTSMSEVILFELNNGIAVLTYSVLIIWVALDWYRSYIIHRELEDVRKQTEQLRTIAGNTLDGLRYVVHLRGSVAKTAVQLGKRAIVKVAHKTVKDREEKSGKRSLARVALTAIDRLVSFPERVAGHIANWAKDTIDEKLKQNFKKYASRSNMMFAALVFWSLVPAIWLAIIATMYG